MQHLQTDRDNQPGENDRPSSGRTWHRAVREAAGLILLSALLAFGVNAVRNDGLALRPGDAGPSPRETSGNRVPSIAIGRAAALFHSGGALFVDARSRADFEAAHIPGAVSLPLADVDDEMQGFILQTDPRTAVIVYCGEQDCHLSEQLAGKIRDWGYPGVFFLENGLAQWQAQGMPLQ